MTDQFACARCHVHKPFGSEDNAEEEVGDTGEGILPACPVTDTTDLVMFLVPQLQLVVVSIPVTIKFIKKQQVHFMKEELKTGLFLLLLHIVSKVGRKILNSSSQ